MRCRRARGAPQVHGRRRVLEVLYGAGVITHAELNAPVPPPERYSERAFDERRAGHSTDRYTVRADDGLRRQNDALTRLRLLASNDVVACAEAVQREDEAVMAWFSDPQADPTEAWDMLNASRQNARQAFLSAYRRAFGLGKAKAIISSRSKPA
jgi:hypothetical protein